MGIVFVHFQVLSILPQLPIQWPEQVTRLLSLFGIFALDLELAQPECASPWFKVYSNRWIVVVGMPIVALMVLTLPRLLVGVLDDTATRRLNLRDPDAD